MIREGPYNEGVGIRIVPSCRAALWVRTVTILSLPIFFAPNLFAVEVASEISDREIIESMAEIKAGQKAAQQQINDLKESTQQQINDLKESTQQQIAGLQRQISDLRESMQQQMADLRNLIYVVLAGMFSLFGFVLWDRRTALMPAVRKQEELEKREALIEKALAEYAGSEPRLADILHKLRLM